MTEFMPNEAYFENSEPENRSVRFSIGEIEYTVPLDGSLIRRYSKGEGINDHFIHFSHDGFFVFLPGVEEDAVALLDNLELRGVRVESFDEPDEQTIKIIAKAEAEAMFNGAMTIG